MDHIGTWVFHSIAAMNDDESGFVYLSAEDYLKSPMPYVDETDEEAVADELRERKKWSVCRSKSVRTASSICSHRCPRAYLRKKSTKPCLPE